MSSNKQKVLELIISLRSSSYTLILFLCLLIKGLSKLISKSTSKLILLGKIDTSLLPSFISIILFILITLIGALEFLIPAFSIFLTNSTEEPSSIGTSSPLISIIALSIPFTNNAGYFWNYNIYKMTYSFDTVVQ